jgi:hypothetical protein
MVGITLGLPAGYFGGRLDTVLSFLANLVLAFPVILLFYLLVTPEIRQTPIPTTMAASSSSSRSSSCTLFLEPLLERPDMLAYYARPDAGDRRLRLSRPASAPTPRARSR